MAKMLALPDRPTAIFAGSNTKTIGLLEATSEAKLRVKICL
jgi:DNA-binding LacI/PurR family transcriptional regulator